MGGLELGVSMEYSVLDFTLHVGTSSPLIIGLVNTMRHNLLSGVINCEAIPVYLTLHAAIATGDLQCQCSAESTSLHQQCHIEHSAQRLQVMHKKQCHEFLVDQICCHLLLFPLTVQQVLRKDSNSFFPVSISTHRWS